MQQVIYQGSHGIGSALRSIRRKTGMTQAQVAARLQLMGFDVTAAYYGRMERNCHSIPINVLVALKGIYQVQYEDFFRDLP